MDLYSVDIDEVMKLGDEALNASSLQFCSSIKLFFASSLQFFLSVKLFIAIIFYEKTSFNTSSLLLFKRNSSFNASSPLLFKVTLPTSGLMYTDIIFYRLFLQSGGALPSFRLIGWMFSRISHKKVWRTCPGVIWFKINQWLGTKRDLVVYIPSRFESRYHAVPKVTMCAFSFQMEYRPGCWPCHVFLDY